MAVKQGNSLAEKYPDIASEWDYCSNELTPSDYNIGSKFEAVWKCPKGHLYHARINNRVSNGSGCPYCSNKKVLIGYNDLATTDPSIAQTWDKELNDSIDLKPTDVTRSSNKVAHWVCSQNSSHRWEAKISTRSSGRGCPYCAGKMVDNCSNSLEHVNPTLAKEWHPLYNGDIKASDVTSKSNKDAWWLGACGHEWKAKIANRSNGAGCPICAGKVIEKGFNDLETCRPDLVEEWDEELNDGLQARNFSVSSGKKVWWRCKQHQKHTWEAIIADRTGKNVACPYCSGHQVMQGFNDLLTKHPEICKEWDYEANNGLMPTDVVSFSTKEIHWVCKRNPKHKWVSTVKNRVYNKSNCPHCVAGLHTSFPEQRCFHMVKQYFPDAINGYKSNEMQNREIDIFIPSLRVAIEYDGKVFHEDADRDIVKSNLCKDANINLIRLREKGCVEINDDSVKIEINTDSEKQFEDAIKKLLMMLGIQDPVIDLSTYTRDDFNDEFINDLTADRTDNIRNKIA